MIVRLLGVLRPLALDLLLRVLFASGPTLRERVEELEEDTPDAFKKSQQRVRLLVEKIVATRDEGGDITIELTYRFDPGLPEKPAAESDGFISDIQNSSGMMFT